MTLVEALVGAALVALLFGCLASVLVPAMHAQARERRRSDAQQGALVALERLREETRTSWPDSLAVDTATVTATDGAAVRLDRVQMITWESAAGQDPLYTDDGDLLWQRRQIFFVRDGTLFAHTVALTPSVAPAPAIDPAWPLDPGATACAHNVRSLALNLVSTGVLSIDVVTEVEGQRSEMQSTVSCSKAVK